MIKNVILPLFCCRIYGTSELSFWGSYGIQVAPLLWPRLSMWAASSSVDRCSGRSRSWMRSIKWPRPRGWGPQDVFVSYIYIYIYHIYIYIIYIYKSHLLDPLVLHISRCPRFQGPRDVVAHEEGHDEINGPKAGREDGHGKPRQGSMACHGTWLPTQDGRFRDKIMTGWRLTPLKNMSQLG